MLSGKFEEWPSGFRNGSLPGDPTGDTVFQFVDGNFAMAHGGGSQLLDTVESDDDFGYVVHADPATSTFDVLGVSGETGLPSISNPTSASRGFAMTYGGPEATSSGLIIDVLEGHAED